MRLSRPCYDKAHRCPGSAGGGPKYPKRYRCSNGYVTFRTRWWFGRCNRCDVLVLPPAVMHWIAPSEWRWRVQGKVRTIRWWLSDNWGQP